MVKMHSTVVTANNEVINRRIDENFSLGESYAFSELSVTSNTVTVTGKTHVITSTGSSEEIDTISGAVKGQTIKFFADSGVLVKFTEDDNIAIEGTTNTSIYISGNEHFEVIYNGTNYVEIGGIYSLTT